MLPLEQIVYGIFILLSLRFYYVLTQPDQCPSGQRFYSPCINSQCPLNCPPTCTCLDTVCCTTNFPPTTGGGNLNNLLKLLLLGSAGDLGLLALLAGSGDNDDLIRTALLLRLLGQNYNPILGTIVSPGLGLSTGFGCRDFAINFFGPFGSGGGIFPGSGIFASEPHNVNEKGAPLIRFEQPEEASSKLDDLLKAALYGNKTAGKLLSEHRFHQEINSVVSSTNKPQTNTTSDEFSSSSSSSSRSSSADVDESIGSSEELSTTTPNSHKSNALNYSNASTFQEQQSQKIGNALLYPEREKDLAGRFILTDKTGKVVKETSNNQTFDKDNFDSEFANKAAGLKGNLRNNLQSYLSKRTQGRNIFNLFFKKTFG